jgi:DNA-binding YbaB/EbfC family protein
MIKEVSMNLSNMMKQAQKIQEKIAQAQEELGSKTVESTAGGGMVTVVANGKQEIVSVRLLPDVVDPDDIPMLEDLITSAVNAALRSSKALLQEELAKITGGLRIPGLNL